MSGKGKSVIRAVPGSDTVDSDIESNASESESVTVLNTKKRPLPTTAAKTRDIRGKGKKLKTEVNTETGVLFPSLVLDFPSEDVRMDHSILIGSAIGECGGTFLILLFSSMLLKYYA